jgi:hypothetical protein
LEAFWSHWSPILEKHFLYNLAVYKSLGVHVYFIEEPPFQPGKPNQEVKYKTLLDQGKLTNNNLRNISLTTAAHNQRNKNVSEIMSKFRGERGFTYIPLNDLLCDDQVCIIGTVYQPYYSDNRHMNYAGVSRLKERVGKYVSY